MTATPAQLAALDAGRPLGAAARRKSRTYRARLAEKVLARVLQAHADGWGDINVNKTLATAAAALAKEDEVKP